MCQHKYPLVSEYVKGADIKKPQNLNLGSTRILWGIAPNLENECFNWFVRPGIFKTTSHIKPGITAMHKGRIKK